MDAREEWSVTWGWYQGCLPRLYTSITSWDLRRLLISKWSFHSCLLLMFDCCVYPGISALSPNASSIHRLLALNAFSLHASAIKLKKCKPSASRKRDRIFQHDGRYMRCRCIIWLGIRQEILPWICGLNLISSTISLMLETSSSSSRCKKIS